MQQLVAEVEAAEAARMTAPQASGEHFNAKGLATRKGRRRTGAAAVEFLGSLGARQCHSGGRDGREGDAER